MLPPRSSTTYHCTQCKWTTTVKPASDVLIDGFNYFSKCPACQSEVTASANNDEEISLISVFKRIFGSK